MCECLRGDDRGWDRIENEVKCFGIFLKVTQASGVLCNQGSLDAFPFFVGVNMDMAEHSLKILCQGMTAFSVS